MVTIPFSDFASFDEEVTLDGTPYRVRFDYNNRFGFWSMSFRTVADVDLISGIKLVIGYDLLDQYPGHGLPPGQIFVVDTTDEEIGVNRDNILDPLALVYIEGNEI